LGGIASLVSCRKLRDPKVSAMTKLSASYFIRAERLRTSKKYWAAAVVFLGLNIRLHSGNVPTFGG